MPGEVQQDVKYMMTFRELNAGPDGVHFPGATKEISADRAAALADDNVATYADKGKADEHAAEMEKARDVNAKRVAAGLHAMPVRMALEPGAETAHYRPPTFGGGPPGPPDWRELQKLVDALKAQEEAGATHAKPAAHSEHAEHVEHPAAKRGR